MSEGAQKPEWLDDLVQRLARDLPVSEAEIRARAGYSSIHDSLSAVEFVMELEEELDSHDARP